MSSDLSITGTSATSYDIPTDAPEGDGTFTWDLTTLILIELEAGGECGIGYTYSHPATVPLARDLLQRAVHGADPLNISQVFVNIRRLQRNYGSQGIAATALSAIDIALWDLKARLLGQPLCGLLGCVRDAGPVYGSGGFTTYNTTQLENQLGTWVQAGIPRVKMKIGAHPEQDFGRVQTARKAIGPGTELFVDANGAYSRKQALAFAQRLAEEEQVTWFEEPVSSDDLAGLHLLRTQGPAGMDITAGEYGWRALDLQRMLAAEAVDVLQADATRCGGVTGFMQVAALAEAHPLPLSAHCGPSIHMHLACAAPPLRHVEYFHDHVRIEQMLFDGFRVPVAGAMQPDLSRPGLGLTFKHKDAERFKNDL